MNPRSAATCSHLLLVVTGLFAAATATSQQRLLDDFSSGNDAAWTRTDNLLPAQLGTTQYTVVGGRYRIASSTSLPPSAPFVLTGAYYAASQSDPVQYANGVVRALVRMENDTTNTALLMRHGPGGQGYFFAVNNHENHLFAGILTATGTANRAAMPFPIATQTDYMVETSCLGDRMTLKVWSAGSLEPVQPQLTFYDNSQQQGGVWLGVYNQPASAGGYGGPLAASFDDVMFTPYPVISNFGASCSGNSGWSPPVLVANGHPVRGGNLRLDVYSDRGASLAGIALGTLPGLVQIGLPCPLLVVDVAEVVLLSLDRSGDGQLAVLVPPGLPPMTLATQALVANGSLTAFASSPGLRIVFQP